jgi:Asp/Glu/hydantoin racemase
MKTLVCIHTSMVFVSVETMVNDLMKELLPEVRRINILDDSLLADVMKIGHITPEVARRMVNYVQMAEVAGADVILSLCSSLGPAIDLARPLVKVPVIKIDDAMAEEAVCSAERIGVIATVGTTLTPTVDLIRTHASANGKKPEIQPLLVKGAFELLNSGGRSQHDEMVSAGAKQLAGQVDLLVCAQASMARLAPRLNQETGKRVLTSPRLAIEYTRQVLDSI